MNLRRCAIRIFLQKKFMKVTVSNRYGTLMKSDQFICDIKL